MERNARLHGGWTRFVVAAMIAAATWLIADHSSTVRSAWAQAPQPQGQIIPPNRALLQFGRRVQVRIGNDQNQVDSTDGVFLPLDRDATRQLERAKQLLEDGRYSDAATLLDDILKRDEDYFFKPDDAKAVHRSLKMEAQRLIGNMPPAGLKEYELQFGTRAQQMLTEASAAGDIAKLEAIARRFFHTQAGYQATLLLGKRYLDHAQPLAAALCFQRLLDTPQAAAFEPSLSLLAAMSWLRGGIPQRAGDVLVALRKSDPKAIVRIGAIKVPNFPDSRMAAGWLQSALGKSRKSKFPEVQQWAMHRGNPARNSISSGGMPLLNPRWRVSTTNHPTLEKTLVELRKRYAEEGVAPLPVMQPLAVGDLVLMRTPREVLAIDFVSGKRLWPIRTNDSSLDATPPSEFSGLTAQGLDAQSNPALTDRFWTDATQGTLSSDGVRIYLVQDAVDRASRRDASDRLQMQIDFTRPYNKLTACELQTQGKLKWAVGGTTGEDEPQLAGAYFLGPPLPLQGKLYVLAEINGEIKLCVLEANTGRLEWSQQLAVVEQTILQDPLRMLAGCTPSFTDGVLICPTSAGAVVAVDTTNRSLLWAFQYPRSVQSYQNGAIIFRQNPFGMATMNGGLAERWGDSTAIIADGRVLISPLESDELHCLSLVDGQPQWKAVQRGENLYVGGVHRGNIILVGKRHVSALRLSDGQPAWKQSLELPDSAMPSGRGFLSGDDFFLPLTTAEVARIDVAVGKITHRAKSRKGNIPGNLICYRGEVISQGIDYLESFYQLEPLQERIVETLTTNPNDAWALAHRCEIALEEGRLEQAVTDIRRAYQSDPTPLTRDLLIEAFVAALAQDFGKYQALVAELEPLVQFDQDRAKFLRVVAAGLHKEGKTAGALDAYLKLAELPLPPDDELDDIDSQFNVRRDRWIRANVNELIATAGSDERAKIEAIIQNRLTLASGQRTSRLLRQFLSFFGDQPAAEQARALLVEQTSGPTVLLEREQLLRKLEQSSDSSRRKEATLKLAGLLRDAGQEQAALACYQRLSAEFGDAALVDGKTVAQMLKELPTESPLRRAAMRSSKWPSGEIDVEKPNRVSRNNAYVPPFLPIEMRGPRGPFFENFTIGWYQQPGGELVARDGWGGERFRLSVNANQRGGYNIAPNIASAMCYGHLLVLFTGSQVLGIDTLRSADGAAGRVLWRQDVGDPSANNTYFDGTAQRARLNGLRVRARNNGRGGSTGSLGLVNANGVFIQRSRDIMALDPLSGKPLWIRQASAPNCELFGDEEVIIIAAPDTADRKGLVVRAIDGSLVGTCRMPPIEQRWTSYGRCMLSWTGLPDGKQELKLFDPWRDRDVWSATFAGGVKGTIVDDENIALMEPDGRFTILSLADGRAVIDQKLEAEPKLEGIYVVRSSEQDMLVVDRSADEKVTTNRRRRHVQPPPDGVSPLVTGRIYAFNRATNKLQWSNPGSVEEHGLLLSQPNELPVLLFMRNIVDPESGSPNQRGSVLCIDRRTGRMIYEDDNLPQQIANLEAVANRDDKTIAMNVLQQPVVLKLTDKPVAPEPPYQAGAANEWTVRDTLGRALQMATEPESEPVKINQDPFAPNEPKK